MGLGDLLPGQLGDPKAEITEAASRQQRGAGSWSVEEQACGGSRLGLPGSVGWFSPRCGLCPPLPAAPPRGLCGRCFALSHGHPGPSRRRAGVPMPCGGLGREPAQHASSVCPAWAQSQGRPNSPSSGPHPPPLGYAETPCSLLLLWVSPQEGPVREGLCVACQCRVPSWADVHVAAQMSRRAPWLCAVSALPRGLCSGSRLLGSPCLTPALLMWGRWSRPLRAHPPPWAGSGRGGRLWSGHQRAKWTSSLHSPEAEPVSTGPVSVRLHGGPHHQPCPEARDPRPAGGCRSPQIKTGVCFSSWKACAPSPVPFCLRSPCCSLGSSPDSVPS